LPSKCKAPDLICVSQNKDLHYLIFPINLSVKHTFVIIYQQYTLTTTVKNEKHLDVKTKLVVSPPSSTKVPCPLKEPILALVCIPPCTSFIHKHTYGISVVCELFLLLLACYYFFETGSDYVAQAGLELTVLLLQPRKYWDYRCAPPCPAETLYFEM
jgi:hypothetical protein